VLQIVVKMGVELRDLSKVFVAGGFDELMHDSKGHFSVLPSVPDNFGLMPVASVSALDLGVSTQVFRQEQGTEKRRVEAWSLEQAQASVFRVGSSGAHGDGDSISPGRG
jgi:hypothetical protein